MIEFRPTFAQYRGRLAGVIVTGVVLAFVDYFRLHQSLPVYLAEVVGIALVVAIAMILYFRNTLVTSGPQSLQLRNALGLSHRVDDRNLATLLRVPSYLMGGRSGQTELGRLYVLDGDGKRVLRWSTTTWTPAQMDELTTSLAIPVETISETVTPKQLRARYPNAVGPVEAHPIAFGLVIGLAVVVIVIVIVAASFGAFG